MLIQYWFKPVIRQVLMNGSETRATIEGCTRLTKHIKDENVEIDDGNTQD